MPVKMRAHGVEKPVNGDADEEWLQGVFASWCNVTNRGSSVLKLFEQRCKLKLGPLELQSEGTESWQDYMAIAEVDEPTARQAVEEAKAAWQPPKPLLEALDRFRACLQRPQAPQWIEATGHEMEEHIEAIDELQARIRRAQGQGATSVCLVLDAMLL